MLSYHDASGGRSRGKNLLTRIEADGESIVHLGDLGHEPYDEQYDFISNVDCLLIPVGGYFTIDTRTAIRILEMARPKAVVPMHYKCEGNNYPISTVDEFAVKTHAVKLAHNPEDISELRGAVILPLVKG